VTPADGNEGHALWVLEQHEMDHAETQASLSTTNQSVVKTTLIQARNSGQTRLQPLLRIIDKPKESGTLSLKGEKNPTLLLSSLRENSSYFSYLMPLC
jgi:hypothetical protein